MRRGEDGSDPARPDIAERGERSAAKGFLKGISTTGIDGARTSKKGARAAKGRSAAVTRAGQGFLDEALVGLVAFDTRGSIVDVSRGMRDLLGVKDGPISGVSFSRFLTSGSETVFRRYLEGLVASGREGLCELTLKREDGRLVRAMVRGFSDKKRGGPEGIIKAAFVNLDSGDGPGEHRTEAAGELKAFADNVPDGIFRLDRKLKNVLANRAIVDLLGRGEERLPDSLDDWNFASDATMKRVKRSVRKAFAAAQPQEVELTCDREGVPGYFSMHLIPETGADGKVDTILGIVRDITPLKRNEAEIQAEHSFREAISRSLSIGISAIDDRGKQIYVNPAFCRIVGWSKEELLGQRFPYVYWPRDERGKARRIFLKIRKGGKTSGSFELNLQRRDGTRFDALIMYSAFYDNSGNRIGWIGSVGDISGLKRKEKELQRLNKDLDAIVRKRTDSLRVQNRNLRDILMGLNRAQEELRLSETRVLLEKQRLETILNVVPAGVIVVEGKEGRIAYVNRLAQTLFGRRRPSGLEMVDNLAQLKLLRPDGQPYPYEDLPLNRSLFHGETVRGEEMALARLDGQIIPILANTTPFMIGHEIVGAVGSFVDITNMKISEESIRTLNTELAKNLLLVEDTNKELEGFVHSVTHDLRSPLVVINGFSRRLLDLPGNEFNEKSQDYIEYIRETSQNALFLVRDLLRLFKIARGEMNKTVVDLTRMSRLLQQYFGGLYPRRSVRLVTQDDVKVMGDYNLLKIVMENLIGNSYKFTAKNDGEAIVEVGSYEAEEGLVVFVRDNGCGFDMTRAGRIFEPFARLHKETEYKGSGIGLATVKRIVHRHGGRIWADSEPGRGTAFYFTLPA